MNIALVGLGGFVGAILRYLIYLLSKQVLGLPSFSATLAVNVTGCFCIGALMAWLGKNNVSHQLFLLLGTGALGSFTTFSAFGLDTFNLYQQSGMAFALINVFANLILGIGAVFIAFSLLR